MSTVRCSHCGSPTLVEEWADSTGIICEECELTILPSPEEETFSDADPGL